MNLGVNNIQLGELCEINPESITKDYPFDVIQYVDISSIGSGMFLSPPKVLALRESPSRAKRIVKDQDTIIAMVRPNLRAFYHFKKPDENTIASTGFAVLRAKEGVDPRFVYYAISNRMFTEYLTNNAKGTSYPAVDTSTILRGEVSRFSPQYQSKIASILSPYDDLIENNNRRIALLEESARLLYREWFVRLRFPGHENTRITDDVPEGWERVRIADLSDSVRYGFTASASQEEVGPSS